MQVRNPVMFVVEIGAVITTVAWLIQLFGGRRSAAATSRRWFTFTVAVWLWLTVVFANLAEALAEGRGRAQAATLRAMRTETVARLRDGADARRPPSCTAATSCVVEAGEVIPGDGTVIEGIASVDESAITGESAPGHPRVRRRPQRGHRRHARALATASSSRSRRSPASRSSTA